MADETIDHAAAHIHYSHHARRMHALLFVPVDCRLVEAVTQTTIGVGAFYFSVQRTVPQTSTSSRTSPGFEGGRVSVTVRSPDRPCTACTAASGCRISGLMTPEGQFVYTGLHPVGIDKYNKKS
jgi:hypothetical protein